MVENTHTITELWIGILLTNTMPCLHRDSNPRFLVESLDILTIRPRRSMTSAMTTPWILWRSKSCFNSFYPSVTIWDFLQFCFNYRLTCKHILKQIWRNVVRSVSMDNFSSIITQSTHCMCRWYRLLKSEVAVSQSSGLLEKQSIMPPRFSQEYMKTSGSQRQIETNWDLPTKWWVHACVSVARASYGYKDSRKVKAFSLLTTFSSLSVLGSEDGLAYQGWISHTKC
jgi:hypothetical protein